MSRRSFLNLSMMLVIVATVLGFFSIVKEVVYANYHHMVYLSTPAGDVRGAIYYYDQHVDIIYTINGSSGMGIQYYILVHGKLWGKCSPDMTGCTANGWIVKDNQPSEKWWSSATDFLNLNVRGLHGIGVVKHSVIHLPSYPTVTGYTSEHGTTYADGANGNCFYWGPAAHAGTISGLPCP